MTRSVANAEPGHDVVIVGAGAAGLCAGVTLLQDGLTDFTILEKADDISCPPWLGQYLRLGHRVISSVFDDDTDTWVLKTRGGDISRGRVVIATDGPLFVPWIPNHIGQNDFQGVSFHSAAWHQDFDPAGKRVAVVGVDSTAGRSVDRLVALAPSVKVFAYPPRRFVPVLRGPLARRRRWLRRRLWPMQRAGTHRQPELVRSPIETVTTRGIGTCDGGHHDADAIIYGTGLAIADEVCDDTLVGTRGLTIRRAWQEGMEPYLGVAVHGFPNYFVITGPDYEEQVRYIIRCLRLMTRRASSRIEVRHSTQHVFNERVQLRRPTQHWVASAFDLSSNAGVEDETYDGSATLTVAGASRQVRVRLTGYLDPIDGRHHWQGTLFDPAPTDLLRQTGTVTLTVGERSAPARITEETPQGTHTIVGVGVPPFAAESIELTVPQR